MLASLAALYLACGQSGTLSSRASGRPLAAEYRRLFRQIGAAMAKTVTGRAVLDRGGLTDEQLVAMLWNMLLQRQLDNRGFQLNRQGKIPFALGSEGHEALQAGAAMAFVRGTDILAPYYRDLGLVLGAIRRSICDQHVRPRSRPRAGVSFRTTTARPRRARSRRSSPRIARTPRVPPTRSYEKRERPAVVLDRRRRDERSEWHEAIKFRRAQIADRFCAENGWAISTPQSSESDRRRGR